MKRTLVNEFGETVVTMDEADRGPLTEAEQRMVIGLSDFDDIIDEDCPPMPDDMLAQMQSDIAARRRARMTQQPSGAMISAVGAM